MLTHYYICAHLGFLHDYYSKFAEEYDAVA